MIKIFRCVQIIHIINSCVAMIWILLQAAVVKTLGRDAREKQI